MKYHDDGSRQQETRQFVPSPYLTPRPYTQVPPVAENGPGEVAARIDLSNLRFLVAEDHEFQLETITKLLRRLGALAVYGARDGASALRALQDPAHPIDILLLDLAMPGMDGVELLRTLGASKAPVAVILNSSFDADFLNTIQLLAEGYDANVLGAAVKPLTEEKLRPLVDLFRANLALRASGQ